MGLCIKDVSQCLAGFKKHGIRCGGMIHKLRCQNMGQETWGGYGSGNHPQRNRSNYLRCHPFAVPAGIFGSDMANYLLRWSALEKWKTLVLGRLDKRGDSLRNCDRG